MCRGGKHHKGGGGGAGGGKGGRRWPRSRRCIGLSPPSSAAVRARRERKKVTKANAERPQPTRKVMPNMVELHCGSIDISQSMEKNVMTSTISTSPEAAHLRRESSVNGERFL